MTEIPLFRGTFYFILPHIVFPYAVKNQIINAHFNWFGYGRIDRGQKGGLAYVGFCQRGEKEKENAAINFSRFFFFLLPSEIK